MNDDYKYDKEFFNLNYIDNNSCAIIEALKTKKNFISCIENKKKLFINLIDFYLKKSPI